MDNDVERNLLSVPVTVDSRGELSANQEIDQPNVFDLIRKVRTAPKISDVWKHAEELQKLLGPDDQSLAQLGQENDLKRLKEQLVRLIVDKALDIFSHENDELLFLYGLKLDLIKLEETFQTIKAMHENRLDRKYLSYVNQTRRGDTVLLFVLKYGDLQHDSFLECVKVLIREKVDVNRCDVAGHLVIDRVCLLYKKFSRDGSNPDTPLLEQLKLMMKLLAQAGSCASLVTEDTKTILKESVDLVLTKEAVDEKTKLFNWVLKGKEQEILQFEGVDKYANCDDGEHTLLQLACKRHKDKMIKIAKLLLNKKADPNKVTKWTRQTPLELSAINNQFSIFDELQQ